MGKTLIINGADFSAIKVGNVEVPRVYQQKTLDWISLSGNTFTDVQKEALDDLVLELMANNSALWNKLDRIWLPMIAIDKAHSLVEYKNEVNSYESMNATNQGTFNNSVGFGNLGIYPTATSSTRAPIIDSSLSIDTKNVSMFTLNTQAYPDVSTSLMRTSVGTNNGSNDPGGVCVSSKQNIPNGAMNMGYPTSNNNVQSTGVEQIPSLRGTISDNSSRRALFFEDIKTIGSALETSNTIANIVILSGGNPFMAYEDKTPMGAAIIGKAVTDEEALALQEKVNALLSAMSA